jgi:hypothetical protein
MPDKYSLAQRKTSIVLLLLVRVLAFAHADCSCPDAKPEDLVDRASDVFQGRLLDIRTEKKTKERRLFFEYLENYKGDLKEDTDIRDDTAGTDCAIAFKEGEIYMVYARWEQGFTVIKSCSGTKLVKLAAGEEAAAVGPSDDYRKKLYAKMQVLCMGHRDTFCCLNSLKALEAGKYFPEPDEGCPEDMKPDRLRCNGSLVWCVPITTVK